MDQQKMSAEAAPEISISLSDADCKRDGLNFKVLLERFYLMNCIVADDIATNTNDTASGFLKNIVEM